MITTLLALAQETGGGGAQAPGACGGQGMSTMFVFAMMFAVFYFIIIRPQQKRAKEHQNMLAGLKKGDHVITRGGIMGRVSGVQDKYVVLEVQEKVRIRVLKNAIEALDRPAASTARDKDQAKSDKADAKQADGKQAEAQS